MEDDTGHSPPGDTSMPNHKRKRLTQACDICRKKKIKCDGGKPYCANCLRLDLNCTYIPSNKKRGPRQGYVEMLEKRLSQMEKFLGPLKEQGIHFDAEDDSSGRDHESASPGEEEEKDIFEFTERSFFGGTSPLSTFKAQGPAAAASANIPTLKLSGYTHPASIGAHHHTHITSPAAPSRDGASDRIANLGEEFPPREIIYHLIDVYYEFIFASWPLLHRDTLMEKIESGRVSKVLLWSLMAAAARYSDHPAVKENPPWYAGEKYAVKARKLINATFDTPSLSTVQALVFLNMHEVGCSRGPRAWMYSGMASRMAQELGLNKEDSLSNSRKIGMEHMSWKEKEERRRAFWGCYLIDRFSSAGTGRPPCLDDRDIEVALPSSDEHWLNDLEIQDSTNLDGNASLQLTAKIEHDKLSALGHIIRMTAILGKATQFVNRTKPKDAMPRAGEVAKLDAVLNAWQASLPKHLQYNKRNLDAAKAQFASGGAFLFMHLLYHTVVVLIHRPTLAMAELNDKGALQPWFREFVDRSLKRCMASVNTGMELLRAVLGAQVLTITAFISYCTYTIATVLVNNAFSKDQEVVTKARSDLAVCYKIFQEIKPYWSMADKLYLMTRDLYTMHSRVAHAGTPTVLSMTSQKEPSTLIATEPVTNTSQAQPEIVTSPQQMSEFFQFQANQEADILNIVNGDFSAPISYEEITWVEGSPDGLKNSSRSESSGGSPPTRFEELMSADLLVNVNGTPDKNQILQMMSSTELYGVGMASVMDFSNRQDSGDSHTSSYPYGSLPQNFGSMYSTTAGSASSGSNTAMPSLLSPGVLGQLNNWQ